MRNFSRIFVAIIATVMFFGCFLSVQTAFAGGTGYVDYYGNGSTSGSYMKYTFAYGGSHVVKANWFSRTGYTFDCWNTNASGTGTNYPAGTNLKAVYGGLTLYAKWKQNYNPTPTTISITYCANGGTGSNFTDYVTSGTSYTIRQNTFSRSGYSFFGWTTNANGSGTFYSPGQTFCFTSSMTLYALWTPAAVCQVQVTYCPNGAGGSNIVDTITAGASYTIRQNPFSRSGYTFVGWTTNVNGTGSFYFPGQVFCFSSSITLYAQWTAVVCPVQVTYCPNGASGSNVVDSVNPGVSYYIRQNPFSRPGYNFVNWNTKADGKGTSYLPNQIVCLSSSLTLYAQWSACPITVTYCPNGASGSNIVDSITPGTSYAIRQNPFTRSGYNFVTWNTKADGTGTNYSPGQIVCLSSSLTLYAIWTGCPITVTYCPNGAPGSPIVDTVTPGVSFIIRQNPFTRSGYNFVTWNTKADGTGINYAPGSTACLYSSLILYAIWTPCPITVTYCPNGAPGSPIVDNVTPGIPFAIRQNPFIRTGYTFTTWNTKADGTGTSYPQGMIATLYSSLTLYAQWTVCPLAVAYYPNGAPGSVIIDSPLPGTNYTIRQNQYIWSGYTFMYWNTKADGTGSIFRPGEIINITASMALYAIWSQCPVTVTYEPNGGTGTPVVDLITPNYVTRRNPFTRAGYKFVSWNAYANGSGPNIPEGVPFSSTVSVTLYAKWEKCTTTKVKVTYYPNGGVGTEIVDSVISGSSYTIRQNTFSRSSYTFDTWNTKADGTGENYPPGRVISSLTTNLTLYAKWKPSQICQVIIVYMPNGAPGDPFVDYVDQYTNYEIKDVGFRWANHTQNGWNTLPGGTGTPYQTGQIINNISAPLIIYAQWTNGTPMKYKVTYHSNYDVGIPETTHVDEVDPNTTYTIRGNMFNLPEDYTFRYWAMTSTGGGNQYMEGDQITVTADVHLYGTWKIGL